MNVPKLRFNDFNDDYVINTFDNLINIIDGDRGNNYPKASDFYGDEYCLFLNAGNVTKKGFNFSNKYFITFKKDNELKNGKLKRNDVVLTTRGTVGNVALYDYSIPFENIRINSGMVINRIKNDKILLPQYLYRFMQSTYFEYQIKKTNFGSAQPQLTKSGITKFTIAYPCVKEQSKVSIFLSLLDKKIELQSQKIEALKLYKKGLIISEFSNSNLREISIKELGRIITGTTPSKDNNIYWENGNIAWITPTDITYYKDINSSSTLLTSEGLKKGRFIPKNSILITCIASIGKNAKLLVDGSCNQQINAIIPDKQYNSDYIYYLMEYMEPYFKSIAGTTATSIINKETFENIKVKIHSPEKREFIGNFLNYFENKILLEDLKLENLRKIKKGFMQNMFV